MIISPALAGSEITFLRQTIDSHLVLNRLHYVNGISNVTNCNKRTENSCFINNLLVIFKIKARLKYDTSKAEFPRLQTTNSFENNRHVSTILHNNWVKFPKVYWKGCKIILIFKFNKL